MSADQEAPAIETSLCSQCPRGGATPLGHMGGTGWVRRRTGQEPWLWSHREEPGGEQAEDGLYECRGSRHRGCPWLVDTWPWGMRAGGGGPQVEAPQRRGRAGSELASLHLKLLFIGTG